jgi:hypothetical protein
MRRHYRHRLVLLAAVAALLIPGLAAAQAAVGTCAPVVAGTASILLTNGEFVAVSSQCRSSMAQGY